MKGGRDEDIEMDAKSLSLRARVSNEGVRRILLVPGLRKKYREGRVRWCRHVMSSEDNYNHKKIERMEVSRRRRSQPKRHIKDCYEEGMEEGRTSSGNSTM